MGFTAIKLAGNESFIVLSNEIKLVRRGCRAPNEVLINLKIMENQWK